MITSKSLRKIKYSPVSFGKKFRKTGRLRSGLYIPGAIGCGGIKMVSGVEPKWEE